MNYCVKCGNKLPDNSAFCPNCGYQINSSHPTQPVNNTPEISPEDDKAANRLVIISIILFFAPSLIGGTLAILNIKALEDLIVLIAGSGPLVAIVLMIVTRVKYPKNKLSKIVMWIFVGMIILGILGSILIVVACMAACRGC